MLRASQLISHTLQCKLKRASSTFSKSHNKRLKARICKYHKLCKPLHALAFIRSPTPIKNTQAQKLVTQNNYRAEISEFCIRHSASGVQQITLADFVIL